MGLPTFFAMDVTLLKSVTYDKKAAFEHTLIHKKWGFIFETNAPTSVRSPHVTIALQAGAKV